ncbi:hypothetical protein CVT25_003196 [Psilocybe cyanescens]|uniref:26S proteasome regulatory subunit Rpn6 N-terminal domain-containing protein n=1 Tax=Psilocybe cyanescens TaxID=93625 RepID=A0A409WZU8_PSICY|nr:hypothetical protein CVT25_003196 [Psilocybe cyanescens]
MRDQYESIIGRNLVVPKLYAISAMCTCFSVYEYNKEMNALSPPSIPSDPTYVTDVAPASRWNYELLEDVGEKKMRELVLEIKRICQDITESTSPNQSGEGLRDQEAALVKLGELYRDQKYAEGLADQPLAGVHVVHCQSQNHEAQLLLCPVRTLLDYFAVIPDSLKVQMKALTDNIAWAKKEKRIFLKHNL